jgi:DNA-binding transcriptional LysR family regulator
MAFDGKLLSGVAAFLVRYPDLSVELIMRDRVGDLVADGFDLALRFGEPPQGTLVARKLIETRVLTVASPSYIKANGRPQHLKDLEERDCIDFYDAANARPYDWEMRRKGEVLPLRVKARLLVSDSGTLIGACEAGAGIGQVLEIGQEQLLRSGRLIELFPEWSDERFPLYAIYPSRLHRAAKVREFIEFCSQIIGVEVPSTSTPARTARRRLSR